ncbi:MAG: ABC transporter ATP-binding protein [Shinella sp.]|nr:ABC transporter ATP-binding protein [Shinella sp.]
MIEIRNATKRYAETVVVDDVSISLPAKGITSIIGPNGAGKSTLLSMIARLLPMDGGAILVDGMDVNRTAGDVLARRLSILRQENHLTARLTVRDLVAFGRYPYTKGRPTADDAERISRAIGYLDLQDLADRFLDELSGGQRQRAFVAMILCQDTDYVLFDEPLNSLDIRHAVAMMKLLRNAADQLGKTIVVVLHDINFASTYSDHLVAMQEGTIYAQGTPDEIIDPDVLGPLYGAAFQVHEIEGKKLATYFG